MGWVPLIKHCPFSLSHLPVSAIRLKIIAEKIEYRYSLPKNEPPNGPNYCVRKHKFCKNRDNESNMMNLRLIRSESKF